MSGRHPLIGKPNRHFELLALFVGICLPNFAHAQTTPTELADLSFEDLLNVSVADETDSENARRWAFNYAFIHSKVGGYKNGTNDLSFDDVQFSPGETRTAQNYPVVPTFINQSVHAFSATYAVSDALSLTLAVPYISQGTDHISIVPGFSNFILTSDGVGDVTFNASYQKNFKPIGSVKATIGMRFPIGSIDEVGDTPRNGAGTLERLPYTMQLGSGTYDFTVSLGHSRSIKSFTVSANVNAVIRTGLNDNAYRLGDNYGLAISSRYTKHHWLQPGIRFSLRHVSEIVGGDASLLVPGLFPFPAGITNPSNYGGENATAAISIMACTDVRCKISLTAEASKPFYQNLNGVQPKQKHFVSVTAAAHF